MEQFGLLTEQTERGLDLKRSREGSLFMCKCIYVFNIHLHVSKIIGVYLFVRARRSLNMISL